jgi:outer membrane receptor protein involved in Fe transport
MNSLRKVIFYLSAIILYVPLSLKAQSNADGIVSGKIVDGTTQQPIEFATVLLINKADNKTAKAIQSDMQGAFKFDKVPYNAYILKISYIGFDPVNKEITLSASQKSINAGSITLTMGKNSVLKEVQVVGQKNSIQLGIDKKIFSVEQSLVSEGGSATDLLANVPSVNVDVNGGVNLRGSSNVRILIDGKPSMLAGGNVSQILESIPASSIENIELITNPSSKYDPEGQSGIINIVLKKNKKLGMNGNVSITGGTPDSYNINTGLSYQNGKFNMFGNYSHRYGQRNGGGFSNRINTPLNRDTTYYFNQNSDNFGSNSGDMFKAGFDYNLTDKSTIGISGDLNFRDRNRDEFGNTFGLNQFQTLSRKNEQNNNSSNKSNGYNLNLDFSTKFTDPKEELSANISYSKNSGEDFDNLSTDIYSYGAIAESYYNRIQRNNNSNKNNNWNFQLDYTKPLGESGKFEAGYRGTFRENDDTFLADTLVSGTNNFVRDFNVSTNFLYDEKIHAAYANYQRQLGTFGFQVGARAEQANINTNNTDLNNNVLLNKQDYFRIYPSVFLTQKLGEEQTLQLSYTRRVNRPRGWQINPFLDKSDILNYRQGNPDLMPEDVHSFELSYIKYFKAVTLTSSLYYRQTNDIIQPLRTDYNDQGVQLMRFENLTSGNNQGLEIIAKTDITPKWNFTTNLNFFQSKINGNAALGLADNDGFAWNGNITTNAQLPFNFSGQLRFDYQAPRVMAQGKSRENYGIDAGLKYDFMNKKASLSLNARDILNTRKFGMITSDPSFYMVSERRWQSRTVNLTLAYRFGAMKQDRQKNRNQNDNNSSDGMDMPSDM